MDWMGTGVKEALDALKSALKLAGSKVSKRKQRQLISMAIRELLKLDPDMDAVNAALAKAEAMEVDPTAELYRAKRIRDSMMKIQIGLECHKLERCKRETGRKMTVAQKKSMKKLNAKRMALTEELEKLTEKKITKRKLTKKKTARKTVAEGKAAKRTVTKKKVARKTVARKKTAKKKARTRRLQRGRR